MVLDFIFIVFFLDRVGRRKPLLFGTIGITIALICEAAINSQNPEGTRNGLSGAGVLFIFLVTVTFSLSWGPISWVYMSEIMPMPIRARGSAFGECFYAELNAPLNLLIGSNWYRQLACKHSLCTSITDSTWQNCLEVLFW